MKTTELRKIVKGILKKQGGEIYGADCTMLKNKYGVTGTQIQNAVNYFKYSPQQKLFRLECGM